MNNPHPDLFTDADLRIIYAEMRGVGSPILEVDRVAREVKAANKRWAEGDWLALGLDILTDLTSYAGGPTKNRSQLRDMLEESREEATDEYPNPWDADTVALAEAWLEISPYRLWKITNNAWQAALYELDDQFLGLATGDESGSILGNIVQETFADGVREWREDRESQEAA